MTQILATGYDPALTIIRVVVGAVIFAHGAQKLLGWFGGYGFKGTMGYLTGTAKLPYVIALLVIIIESFGSLGLILGLGTRVAALGIIAVMLGAAITAHRSVGFFMNWNGNLKGEGYEFHIVVIGAAAALVINGGGAYALDSLIARML
ncbi:MAG: DoxX family protein [Spirochaetia bacterium]|nr:DoxX family protein [Spirochaetia bacterium]